MGVHWLTEDNLDAREVGDPGFTAETSGALAAIEADARAAGDRLAARLAARPGWPAFG